MRYVYSVVRFVPDPARGESVNLAVLAGSDDSSEWELRWVDSRKRARALDDRGVLPGAIAGVERLAREIDDYSEAIDNDLAPSVELSEGWLRSLSTHSLNTIQFSAPLPLLAADLNDAISMAAAEFLAPAGDVESASAPLSLRKHAALAAARRAFRSEGLRRGRHYAERVDVLAGPHGREAFDFVVYDGRAVQLVQAWSFQTALQGDLSRRVRAWAWALEGLRRSGGTAVADARNLAIEPNVAVSAIYVPPSGAEAHSVWEEASAAFRELQVRAIPFEEAGRLAVEAARLIRHV